MNLPEFSETLKELLQENSMTAKQLALEIGVAPPTITRYARGERMPDINILVLIADYFNRSTDFLFGKEPENTNLTFKKCPSFNEQIVILAKHFRETYYDFYTFAEIPESSFFEWKNGSSLPTLENIIKIAEKFDCRIDFVLGREV